MIRIKNPLSFKAGNHSKTYAPPGTLVKSQEGTYEKTKISVLEYNESGFEERILNEPTDCIKYINNSMATWLNVEGIKDVKSIEEIGSIFGLHPLTLEDVSHGEQRPKFEEYDNYILVIMKMLYLDNEGLLQTEQLSMILMEHQVITFQEEAGGDPFNFIRKRIKEGKGRIRRCGNDYLCYALIDAVVDSYFNHLEFISDRIEKLDDELMTDPGNETMVKLHQMKQDLLLIRKAVGPARDLITSLQRSENPLIKDSTDLYIRDAYDHILRVIESVESYRDLVSGMMDIYLSSISNRMNEVMKVLTIISTIFIPVTFIAGVYGMNFRYMPELESPYGYGLTWFVMISIMLSLIYYFRRKKWL